MNSFFEGAPVISIYSRAQAIEDGVLVDVTETAKEAGFVSGRRNRRSMGRY